MKWISGATFILSVAFLFSSIALAKDTNSGSFDLTSTAKVGSTELQPGHYKANWRLLSGGNVQIEIMQHGKTIASEQAQIKELTAPASQNSVTTEPTDSGKRVVEMDFSGHKQAIVFGS